MNNYHFFGENHKGDRLLSLYSPEEGYMKGNLFPELYSGYKNYQPYALRPNNEQSKMLLDLSEVSFAAHELNLYLDLHPDDQSMLSLFNDYRKKADQLITEYEEKYGPITLSSSSMDSVPFLWEADVWPFERRDR